MSDKFKEIYRKSIKDPESFWEEASDDIFWFKKPSKILNKSTLLFTNGSKTELQTLATMH